MNNGNPQSSDRPDACVRASGGTATEAPFRSSWHHPLPDDEIERQQRMKERLAPGIEVELRGLGRFIYSGIWDTMHVFYPASGQDLTAIADAQRQRYLKRDLRGRQFIQLPYTLLADEVRLLEGRIKNEE